MAEHAGLGATSYFAGSWIAVTGQYACAVFEGQTQEAVVRDLWRLCCTGADGGPPAVLEESSQQLGRRSYGLLVDLGGDRIVVAISGSAKADVTSRDGVSTLVCPSQVAVARYELIMPVASVALYGGDEFDTAACPVESGVARAGRLLIRWADLGGRESLSYTTSRPDSNALVNASQDDLELTVGRGLPSNPSRGESPLTARQRRSPMVQGVTCPKGHLNPANGVVCRICTAGISPQVPSLIERPSLGVLRMGEGQSILLDRGVLIGREPPSDKEVGGGSPHIVRIGGPEVSRVHVEVKLDDWHVVVTDMHSKNGTFVTLPGRPAERLRPGAAVIIESGTKVVVSDELFFVYQVE